MTLELITFDWGKFFLQVLVYFKVNSAEEMRDLT